MIQTVSESQQYGEQTDVMQHWLSTMDPLQRSAVAVRVRARWEQWSKRLQRRAVRTHVITALAMALFVEFAQHMQLTTDELELLLDDPIGMATHAVAVLALEGIGGGVALPPVERVDLTGGIDGAMLFV